jgi:hypothetical protein
MFEIRNNIEIKISNDQNKKIAFCFENLNFEN